MKRILLLFFCIFYTGFIGFSQKIEDLEKTLNTLSTQEQKEQILWEMCEEFAWTEPSKVMGYTQELINFDTVKSDSTKLIKIIQLQGKAQRSIGNYVTSLELYKQNYEYNKLHQDSLKQAYAANQIGVMNLFNGNMNVAQQYLLEAYEIYKKHGTLSEIAGSNNALANFYSSMDQSEKALARYKKALKAYEEVGDIQGMANVNANLGLQLMDENRLDEAEEHLLESGRLDSIGMSSYSLGFFHDFLGLLRKKQGRYDEAYESMMTALEIRKGLESHYNISETELSLSELHYETKQYSKAIEHAEAIFQFQNESQSLSQQLSAYELLSKSYEKKNDFASSLVNYKKYHAISDSIYQRDMIDEIANKEAQFEKVEKDKEIAILNTKNKANISLLNEKTRTITLGSVALLLIGLLVFFLYSLLTKYKQKKIMLSKTVNEKDILIKEIHHRVKNNLQIVSSLLNLQSRYIDDKVSLEAINTSRARIKAMALLHQNLYSNENLKSVKIKKYFENLGHLYDNYKMTDKKIFFKTSIDDIELDIDSLVPLGLITNELITNAHKHAFNSQHEGEIQLSIHQDGNFIVLNFQDNGQGIPFAPLNEKPKSLGMQLIRAFSKKLNADIDFNTLDGTRFNLRFAMKKEIA